jgi:UDP-glucose 4-epimerase|tara:strand:- start:51 stop:872 length:822 start_codon:yes stop_codon:yes gene_type:complete
MKKVLVTGSSGYIGSHLLKKIKSEFKVFGLDKDKTQIPVKFIHADICNVEYLKYHQEFDCVVHLAAEMRVSESVKDPILYYRTNIIGTLNVLKHIKTKNFIFASTGAAEGMISPYGVSKKAAEEIVFQSCKEKGIDYTIFRFYNVIGSDGIDVKNPDGLFYNLVKSKRTGVFKIFGNDYNTKDGTCVRDYVHVNEICEAIKLALDKPANQIENLGHGCGTSVLEIFNVFKTINNLDIDFEYFPRRAGDIEASVLNDVSPYMKKIYSIEDLLKV